MNNPLKSALGHLVSCKETSRLLSRGQDEPLTAWQRTRMRWHLAVCNMCASFDRQMRLLAEAMRRYRD